MQIVSLIYGLMSQLFWASAVLTFGIGYRLGDEVWTQSAGVFAIPAVFFTILYVVVRDHIIEEQRAQC